ncbi:MAG: TolC family protein, partial [Bacteroidetes bacterium]|nr:TolC family protein [Bacteroidota bacterium]MBU1761702.1 TolC family protein [Bacteroidota bacterium]
MLKFKITGLLLMMGGFSFAQNLTYNLQQCIDTALKNNVALRQNGVDVQSANVDYRQAKENLLPSINGNLNYGYNSGRNVDPITNTYTNNQYSSSNASLSASLVLFNGLRLQNF